MKDLVKSFVKAFVLPNAKAIVAFLVGGAAAWLQVRGVVFEPGSVEAFSSGLVGILTAVLVWLTPNSRS